MKPLSENRKAFFDYKILEKFEAGIVLLGIEVKSIKLGRTNLAGSYVVFRGDNPYLIGAKIPPYQPNNTPDYYNPERTRKLLLQKSEINYLNGKAHQQGLTFIPLKLYTKNGKIKLEFGLAKGKKARDKRELIKKRETNREIDRELKKRG